MMDMHIVELILAFISGSGISSYISIYKEHKAERRARRISILQGKIQNLYGPLQFYISQNESFFKLNNKYLEAYKQEYEGNKWSECEITQQHLREDATKTLDIANAFIHLVMENNKEICNILNRNYAYLDPDDIEIVSQYIVDYTRLKIERDESGRIITPLSIYEQIGAVSFMRPEFIKRFTMKFGVMKREIDLLTS